MNIKTIHREAMLLSQKAFIALEQGNTKEATTLYKKAFDLEKEAALGLLNHQGKEPTRAILFKSAAYLAKKSFQYREAECMACLGLAGNPPESIATELKEMIALLKSK